MFPDDLELTPISRWPTTLPSLSVSAVLQTPVEQRVQAVPSHDHVPRVSVIVVTLDGLAFSRLCLESLLAHVSTRDVEVIVIDNGSTDGTVTYLQALARRDARVRVVFLDDNVGFAAATNRGVALARGEIVILLNNDTIVCADAIERLVAHLADRGVGLLGAVTNRAGNEAEIDAPDGTYGGLRQFARERMQAHAWEAFDIRTATMFCAALRREVWDTVGPLDERFEVGLFEDDDYSMRVRQAGYRVMCAEGVFVHHFGQASLGRLGPTGRYGEIFHANRARWEAKWGMSWRPYARREKPSYRDLVARIRELVLEVVPRGATLAVISKGDGELVTFDGRQAWHFPQNAHGTYAGHYPADSVACIAELERARSKGAEFLVIPDTARWWLRHYEQFGEYLRTRCGPVVHDGMPATIVPLAGRGTR